VYDDEDGNHKFVDSWEEHQQVKNSLNPDWLQQKRDEMQQHHESKINVRKFQTQGEPLLNQSDDEQSETQMKRIKTGMNQHIGTGEDFSD